MSTSPGTPHPNSSSLPPSAIEAKGAHGLTARLKFALAPYSNADVARAAGISAESVRRYLQGSPAPAHFLIAICNHYRISADWLLCNVGAPRLDDSVVQLATRATAAQFFAAIDQKVEAEKQRLRSLLEHRV